MQELRLENPAVNLLGKQGASEISLCTVFTCIYRLGYSVTEYLTAPIYIYKVAYNIYQSLQS